MEEMDECLRQAKEERAEKTTTLLDVDQRPNPDVQQLQQNLACFEPKADKR